MIVKRGIHEVVEKVKPDEIDEIDEASVVVSFEPLWAALLIHFPVCRSASWFMASVKDVTSSSDQSSSVVMKKIHFDLK